MNKRFKELYAESVMCVHDAFIDQMLIPSVVDLQFAELIVKECADIALVEAQSNGNFDTFNKIVKHFGVK